MAYPLDPARHEHERYQAEILETLARTVERQARRMDHDIEEDRETLRLILHELRTIAHELQPPHPPQPSTLSRFSAVHFTSETGDSTMADNVLALNVGQTSQASPITYLADGVTPSGAAYSSVSYAFSDPSATVSINSDGVTATVTGVAPSTGPVSGSVSFTATDTDGAVSAWVQAFTIQTNGVQPPPPPPPSQLSQSSAVQFTTPV
jgi:hypothetical protein